MRPLTTLLLLVIQVWLTGCMKYQFATVSSNMESNANNEHILENDTLILKYNFHGQNCPVTISIQNKLDIPLYVDWRRSALILKDQSYAYWNDKAIIQGTAFGSQVNWTPTVSSTHSTVTGQISRDESVSFIPPRSVKETNLLTVQKDFLVLRGNRNDHREQITVQEMPAYGYHYDYFATDSPLKYRSFLTVSTHPLFSDVSTYENEFWVSEVFETTISPRKYFKDPENIRKFYTARSTGVGTFVGLTGVALIAVLLAL